MVRMKIIYLNFGSKTLRHDGSSQLRRKRRRLKTLGSLPQFKYMMFHVQTCISSPSNKEFKKGTTRYLFHGTDVAVFMIVRIINRYRTELI